jgi:hypothetical protein
VNVCPVEAASHKRGRNEGMPDSPITAVPAASSTTVGYCGVHGAPQYPLQFASEPTPCS